MNNDINIIALPAFSDNYIWLVHKGVNAFVVDPGESKPVLEYLDKHKLKLRAILITHTHQDHIGGVEEIFRIHNRANIYEPKTDEAKFNDIIVSQNSEVRLFGFEDYILTVYETPGHTKNHVSYLSDDYVFCGDALFSCGCGRLFEGDANDLLRSMEFFENLNPEILVCCGHEYTASNIAFAKLVEPNNPDLLNWEERVKKLRNQNKASLPTKIKDELSYNPFLRASNADVINAVAKYTNKNISSKVEVLKQLRAWKDNT